MTHDVFIQAIIENPDDDAARLRYADWLAQQGRLERAAFIRVQCELARLAPSDERRQRMWALQREIIEAHHKQWVGWLGNRAPPWAFRRGFVDSVLLGVEEFLRHANDLTGLSSILGFKLFGAGWEDKTQLAALAGCPLLARVTALELNENGLTADDLRVLASSPHLTHLASLDLFENLLGVEGASLLASSPAFSSLTKLNLNDNDLGDEGVAALVGSPKLSRLSSLDVSFNEVTTKGVAALAASPHLPRLSSLNLFFNQIDDAGAGALLAATNLDRLARIDLRENSISETMKLLLRSRFGDRVAL